MLKARHVDDGEAGRSVAEPAHFRYLWCWPEKKNPRTSFSSIQLESGLIGLMLRTQEEEPIFICGHYEGYDERIKTLVTDRNLGDYVLTGELAKPHDHDRCDFVRLMPEVISKSLVTRMIAFLRVFSNIHAALMTIGMVVPDVLWVGTMKEFASGGCMKV